MDEIAEVSERCAKIETYLVGLDGRNGLRGELREFKETVMARLSQQDEALAAQKEWSMQIATTMKEYYDKNRRETCYGLEAVAELKRDAAAETEQQQHADEKHEDRRMEDIKSKRLLIGVIVAALVASPIISRGVDALFPRAAPAAYVAAPVPESASLPRSEKE